MKKLSDNPKCVEAATKMLLIKIIEYAPRSTIIKVNEILLSFDAREILQAAEKEVEKQ